MNEIKQQLNKDALLLPFKRRAIFVDWFGVLTEEIFWKKTLDQPKSRLFKKTSALQNCIFSDHIILKNWMKGKISYHEVIETSEPRLTEVQKKKIFRELIGYCDKIILDPRLCEVLKKCSCDCFIVLATDNMDSFYQSLSNLPQLPLFDAILSSNYLGTLKAENPALFFGNWLKSHNLKFTDCLLIDDNKANCEAFTSLNGKSIRFDSNHKDACITNIEKWVESNEISDL